MKKVSKNGAPAPKLDHSPSKLATRAGGRGGWGATRTSRPQDLVWTTSTREIYTSAKMILPWESWLVDSVYFKTNAALKTSHLKAVGFPLHWARHQRSSCYRGCRDTWPWYQYPWGSPASWGSLQTQISWPGDKSERQKVWSKCEQVNRPYLQ